jgi:hypothetical protein
MEGEVITASPEVTISFINGNVATSGFENPNWVEADPFGWGCRLVLNPNSPIMRLRYRVEASGILLLLTSGSNTTQRHYKLG